MMETHDQIIEAEREPIIAHGPAAESAPPAPPCIMVIFGAGGDLTKRLVVPALYNLAQAASSPIIFSLSVSIATPGAPNNGARVLRLR